MIKAGNESIKREVVIKDENDRLIGKTVEEIEKKYNIAILFIENFYSPNFLFSWEHRKPPRNRKIKKGDRITVTGKAGVVSRLCCFAQ